MINDLKYVNEILVWVFFSEDIKMNIIKANIRSRGPIINEVASKYGGGGHNFACGCTVDSFEIVESILNDFREFLKEN